MLELNEMGGIKIDRNNMNSIRYVIEMLIIVDSENKLQKLVLKINEQCRTMGLKINIGKTEVMGVTKASGRLTVNKRTAGEPLKQISSFRYLGC